jgi:AraC-like DNA-binding protein
METQQTRIFFHGLPETPVGRVQGAGYVKDTWRLSTWPMRVLNTYALVYVTEGGGHFRDTGGRDLEILAGDLILLFPNLPHSYGPKPGGKWSEVYAHFDGPAVEVWRQGGLLDPEKPVHRLLPVEQWRAELGTALERPVNGEAAQVVMLCDFLGLLTRMLAAGTLVNAGDRRPRWLQTALALLDDSEHTPPLPAIAADAGMSYHTFRRRFEAETGVGPARYRFVRRMEAASYMLLHTKMKVREIAERLNFSNEYYFSNRFHGYMGMSPSKYRQDGRRGTPPLPVGSSPTPDHTRAQKLRSDE